MGDSDHHKKKRPFERQFDSGVFMGSDGTDMGEGVEELEVVNTSMLPVRQLREAQTERGAPAPEELARVQIESCLEEGNESIDLSYVSWNLVRIQN